MNPDLNRIPESVRSIHLIAICGSGMGALAAALKDQGYHVTGSDHGVYPPMSDFLAARGIPVMTGFDPAHLAHDPDLVVVGNAVIRDNPEARETAALGLPYCSMPQAINHFMVGDRKVLMVTGTHGKTTTASILAGILHRAGMDPSFFIGGIVRDFMSNYRLGGGDYFIIEGDEYDTAFFNKVPKFVHYPPHIAVLTSVEFDHADIYADMDAVRQAFGSLMTRMAASRALVAFAEDPEVRQAAAGCARPPVFYGERSDAAWRLGPVETTPPWTRFTVYHGERPWGDFDTRLKGRHNLYNAMAAMAVAAEIGIPPERVAEALRDFQGPRRRQEIRGVERGVTVMDDFAHHPTAVRETIQGVRPHYPDGRVIAVFEPRTNTSMRRIFQSVYPTVFDGADLVCIRQPSRLDKIPEAERFSSEQLVADLRKRGRSAFHFETTEGIIAFLMERVRSGDLVLVMSNGGFDNIHERLLTELKGNP